MVVEDAHDIRELYANELERAGFLVAQADNGEAALALAHEFEPDVMVLDSMLPGVNGVSVARALRASKGDQDELAILAVTALSSEAMRRTALEAGCDTVLCKPVEPSVVVSETQHFLALRRHSGK